ncbi:hypothetical protein SANTM175S_04932 [Streptomyces antimycoticus]
MKPRRAAPMSWNRLTPRRYSWRAVSRSATPRCHPSTSASDQIQAMDAAQTAPSSPRHGSRTASRGPWTTTAAATARAAGVPGPTWGSQSAYSGAQSTYSE